MSFSWFGSVKKASSAHRLKSPGYNSGQGHTLQMLLYSICTTGTTDSQLHMGTSRHRRVTAKGQQWVCGSNGFQTQIHYLPKPLLSHGGGGGCTDHWERWCSASECDPQTSASVWAWDMVETEFLRPQTHSESKVWEWVWEPVLEFISLWLTPLLNRLRTLKILLRYFYTLPFYLLFLKKKRKMARKPSKLIIVPIRKFFW